MAKIKNQNLIIVGGKEPVLQEKSVEITENGTTTYTADEGFDGLKSLEVTTNIAGSGGGINPALIERTTTEILPEDLQGVTKIGDYAFYNYPALTKIDLPEGVIDIGQYAFPGSQNIELKLPTTLKTIGAYAFQNRTVSNDVVFPNTIETIGSYAFSSSQNGAFKYRYLSVGSRNISDYAFSVIYRYNTNFGYLTLLEGIETIGKGAFGNVGSGADEDSNSYFIYDGLPTTLKTIGDYAFQCCGFRPNDKEIPVTIPDSVTSLGNYAFAYEGDSWANFIVGAGVTVVPNYCFYYYGNNVGSSGRAKYIKFLGDITAINTNAFSSAYFGKIDLSNCTTVPTLSSANSIRSGMTIVVPDELYDDWIVATNWSSRASYIKKKSEDV